MTGGKALQFAGGSKSCAWMSNKKPRLKRGFAVVRGALSLAAASITPDPAIGANAGARRYHHDGRSLDDHDASIGLASAIGTAIEARTASAGGIGGAKAGNRAGKKNCGEKVLHVFFP
jgi:hypothetical protein